MSGITLKEMVEGDNKTGNEVVDATNAQTNWIIFLALVFVAPWAVIIWMAIKHFYGPHLAKQERLYQAEQERLRQERTAIGEMKQLSLPLAGARKRHAQHVYSKKIKDGVANGSIDRREAIAILVEEVGLSAAAARTYYANFKSGKWS